MTCALQAEGLVKRFSGRAVVDGVSLNVHRGEVVGLLGPNGAGKTTVFNLLLGLLQPNGGTVRFGRPLDGMPLYQRARLGIGYLPQGPSVFRGLTVAKNLKVVFESQKMTKREMNLAVEALLNRFGLTSLANQKARLLSGGERRKLEIARALAAKPRMLLCDEPFAGVDPIAAQSIGEIFRELSAMGIGLLMTDHNVAAALSVCDRVHILIDGGVVKSGTPEEIRADEEIRRRYLGENVAKS